MTIGSVLREARERSGLSLREVGERLGMSLWSWNRVETGERAFDPDWIVLLPAPIAHAAATAWVEKLREDIDNVLGAMERVETKRAPYGFVRGSRGNAA
jgi:transcriptional regulator with XRE-family HTH domain